MFAPNRLKALAEAMGVHGDRGGFLTPNLMSPAPTLADLERYNVNRPGQDEVIRWSFYDFQTYAAAGQTQLIYFQVPQGQSGKTKADTTMEAAGLLPNPKRFLITSIELFWSSSVAVSTSAAGVTALTQSDDVYAIQKFGGFLEVFIGSKTYLTEAPLGKFASRIGMRGYAALAGTFAATTNIKVDTAQFGGEPYKLAPPLLLTPNQNFNVTLNWPVAVAVPSASATSKLAVILNGLLYRNSQ
jgi:hypothetical protein